MFLLLANSMVVQLCCLQLLLGLGKPCPCWCWSWLCIKGLLGCKVQCCGIDVVGSFGDSSLTNGSLVSEGSGNSSLKVTLGALGRGDSGGVKKLSLTSVERFL